MEEALTYCPHIILRIYCTNNNLFVPPDTFVKEKTYRLQTVSTPH